MKVVGMETLDRGQELWDMRFIKKVETDHKGFHIDQGPAQTTHQALGSISSTEGWGRKQLWSS